MKMINVQPQSSVAQVVRRPSLRGHLQIARADHWVKNVFVLPGIVVALAIDPARLGSPALPFDIVIGIFAVCLIASSNYVINEVLDAPFDLQHPTKRLRPVPSGRVDVPLAYAQWIALMLAGLALSLTVSVPFALTMAALWVMGCVYNIPPVRTKDLPYLDVLSESVNNPLRMLAGWYIVGTSAMPPVSLLISYWMIGCYFMAIKRFAEYKEIGDPARSAAYRKSFAFYNERRLLVSIMFYGSHAMLFFGTFIMRYRLELILTFPLVALVMAVYLSMAFKQDSAAQRPEGLYREPVLMGVVATCAVLMAALMFIDAPLLHNIFTPSTASIGNHMFNK
ncbi:MAG: UbiA prenyltransferase family protein [Pyrinomonadaceae bacterium]